MILQIVKLVNELNNNTQLLRILANDPGTPRDQKADIENQIKANREVVAMAAAEMEVVYANR
jgi:N-methylhydantoinase B/oxoprolinase/acetone carboxylase alpha subunit